MQPSRRPAFEKAAQALKKRSPSPPMSERFVIVSEQSIALD